MKVLVGVLAVIATAAAAFGLMRSHSKPDDGSPQTWHDFVADRTRRDRRR